MKFQTVTMNKSLACLLTISEEHIHLGKAELEVSGCARMNFHTDSHYTWSSQYLTPSIGSNLCFKVRSSLDSVQASVLENNYNRVVGS
jgi:hypothetical protein